MMVSYDEFSSELAVKSMQVHPNWLAFFAGDVAPFRPIVREANALAANSENAIENVKTNFKDAFRNEFHRHITDKILRRYNHDIESFKQTGLKQLGRHVFNRLSRQIEAISFNLEFLVCGFDKDMNPHIFTVSDPCKTIEHSIPGFHAIGAGYFSALSTLYFHRFKPGLQLARGIYHICEAKFMAESAVGVGSATNVFIIHKSGALELIDSQLVEEIRNAWMQEGRARVPSGIEATIKSAVLGKG